MRGHLFPAEGAEQTGLASLVRLRKRTNKAASAAFNVLRGVTVNAGVPSSPKAAISELDL